MHVVGGCQHYFSLPFARNWQLQTQYHFEIIHCLLKAGLILNIQKPNIMASGPSLHGK